MSLGSNEEPLHRSGVYASGRGKPRSSAGVDGSIQPGMRRVVVFSNRVIDLRKAPQAGGVAVALADVVRLHNGLWFGWNGEITADDKANVVTRDGRIATVPLTETDHQGYYLGYANSVLWPVFHNRLDLAEF